MPWVRIDDHFDEHPKMQQVGPIAWGFWLAGLAYCNRNLTDGFIPWTKARTLCSFEVVEDSGVVWELSRVSGHSGEEITSEWIIDLLVEVGLWIERKNPNGRIDGYEVHDYPEYQPLKAQIEEERAKKVAAGQAGGQASAQARAQAKSKQSSTPYPNPYPVPETEEDLKDPLPPKPKHTATDKPPPVESKSEPFEALVALCDSTGADIAELSAAVKSRQLGKAKQLLAAGMTVADIGKLASYCRSQLWRTSPVDMFTIEKERGKWEMAGKPTHEAAKANGRASPVKQSTVAHNLAAVDEVFAALKAHEGST